MHTKAASLAESIAKSVVKTLQITILLIFCSCNTGFEGKEIFVKDFEERQSIQPEAECWQYFNNNLDIHQMQSMQFLYAYMSLPDMVDYSFDFFLMNVDYALKARKEMPWGKNIPDREFLHFVLPVRVNNENLDESRKIFFEELKVRIKDMSMYDAALEVNHWCHEKANYMPSDPRTSSPLATVRTAYGRCGEESTFTVAALRSVGIPARQVYTPRWAHTDSNHAWVEVWIDGKWFFMGACEPEPVLNLGWFNAPASRGMLMYARVFGKYNGPEEVIERNPCHTEINVTSNYAPTTKTTIKVIDKDKNPVEAIVDFKIYNYGELHTVASMPCDKAGTTSLITGHGDMVAWARKDGKYGFTKYKAGDADTVIVTIDKTSGYTAELTMDIVPPSESNIAPELTEEQKCLNDKRFAQEDSIRNAYISTFITPEKVKELAEQLKIDNSLLQQIMKDSRGNHQTLVKFLKECDPSLRNRAIRLLNVISEKDRRDISLNVLNDHLTLAAEGDLNDDFYNKFILNPRVSNEMLTPYRSFFTKAIHKDSVETYRTGPALWIDWCRKNIKIDATWNPGRLCMSPEGVWKIRTTDAHSRDIFFVAGARSMGIPARIDQVTGKTQIAGKDKKWTDVNFEMAEQESNTPSGILKAKYQPSQYFENPKYKSHFTISKIVDGKLILQNHPREATWESILKNGCNVDAGDYMVMTGTRLANGSVLSHLHFVNVPEDGTKTFTMIQRESDQRQQVIGEFNSENLFYDLGSKSSRSLLSATGRGYYIIALIDPNSEPTNHFLRDISLYRKEFEKWGRKMVLLFENEDAASRFNAENFPNLPSTIIWGTDIEGKLLKEIKDYFKLTQANRPVILLADTFNRVVFLSQGYSIGLGEQLIQLRLRIL